LEQADVWQPGLVVDDEQPEATVSASKAETTPTAMTWRTFMMISLGHRKIDALDDCHTAIGMGQATV